MTAFRKTIWLLVPLAALIAACAKTPSDDTLKNDLALASQAPSLTPPPVVSPVEQGIAPNSYATPMRRTQTVGRAATTGVRRPSSRTSSSAQQAVYQPAPQPTIKHTERDAAIGAASGAVIGVVASRNKVQGGLIGAAAGAILGAVIGNNVDIKKPN
jgi:YmgG-like glycine-zipper protein